MPLDCSKCNGKCCRHIKSEWFDRGDGVCKWLDLDTNKCRIYDDRPIFCNVDRYYDEYMKDKISKEEWYDLQHESCKKIPD